MKYIQILKLIVSLIPTLVSLIKSLEEAIPEPGKGTQKLETLRGILESGYAVANDIGVTMEELWPALSSTINALVAAFNSTGVFKK